MVDRLHFVMIFNVRYSYLFDDYEFFSLVRKLGYDYITLVDLFPCNIFIVSQLI